jgi:hypothetical protein
MAVSDIFSTSFLFSIASIIILIGVIFAYVNYRMTEQDHKLNSMLGLVSTMAEESQFFRNKLNMLQQQISVTEPKGDIQYASEIMKAGDLIDVSDDDSEDDESNDEDSEDESSSTDDSVDGSDEETVSDDSNDNETSHYINLLDDQVEDVDMLVEDVDVLEDDVNVLSQSDIKTVHLEQPIDVNVEEVEELTNSDIVVEEVPNANTTSNEEVVESNENILFLKNISINDLGEVEDTHKTEYKKMTINKLREFVISKGLVDDASKLKKNEILKLLDE